MMQWDRVIVLCLAFTAVVTPFEVALLSPSINATFFLNRVVDTVFIIDICITFIMDPEDGTMQRPGYWPVAWKYLKGWFVVDALGSFPFDAIEVFVHGASGIKYIRILRL